jgi:hypothetical protein
LRLALPAVLLVIAALLAVACAPDPTPLPPTATASATPTPIAATPTPRPRVERTPEAQALRLRAQAFTLARTDARFDDTYLFTSPEFKEVCGPDAWHYGLLADGNSTRAWGGLDDDALLVWTVTLVEVTSVSGSTLVSVATDTGRGLDLLSYTWVMIDGEWWLDESPEDACVF